MLSLRGVAGSTESRPERSRVENLMPSRISRTCGARLPGPPKLKARVEKAGAGRPSATIRC